jgi:hypothetical protein
MATTSRVPATRRTNAAAKRAATTAKTTRRGKQSYDIDAEMAELFGDVDLDEIEVVEFGPVYGEMYHLVKEVNLFSMSGLGDLEQDSAVLQRYMVSMVHPYDQAKFKGAMGRAIALNADRLLHILKRMTEAVADGNPTTMSAVSSRSSKNTGSKALSAGS